MVLVFSSVNNKNYNNKLKTTKSTEYFIILKRFLTFPLICAMCIITWIIVQGR